MGIADIQQTIQPEWDDFQSFYRQQLRSAAAEMDLITNYVYAQKGKQLRPLLVLLCAQLNGGITHKTQVGAAMVELVHTGTLLHDDVIDEAAERRSVPSVNAKWNSKTAILAGDFFYSKGLLVAAETNTYDLLKILAASMQEVGEGEILQMQKSQDLDITEPLYLEIIRKKTASLLQACTHIGAVSGGASASQTKAMQNFGNLLGIAFQLRDDVLDYHTAKVTGKTEGNDIREQKLTLPLIFALQQVDANEQKRVLQWVADAKHNAQNVVEVMNFVKRNNGIAYAEQTTRRYAEQAKALLENYPSSSIKEALNSLVEYIAYREK